MKEGRPVTGATSNTKADSDPTSADYARLLTRTSGMLKTSELPESGNDSKAVILFTTVFKTGY